MENLELKYAGKLVLQADLLCVTGLHIGGREEEFEIGGLDNPVIKDPLTGRPYLPGSSLKGKLRSLLEWASGVVKLDTSNGKFTGKPCDCGHCDICLIFGCPAERKQKEPTRLTVRDAFLTQDTLDRMERILGANIYTEIKSENALDRLTSAANPRPMERVPAGSKFGVELVYDLYKEGDRRRFQRVLEAMRLLEDSALGGGGSRGSGKVQFTNLRLSERDLAYYQEGREERWLSQGHKTLAALLADFPEIVKE